MDPHGKRQLLAGDAVDQRLEDGGKARWLESTHARGERAEQRVGRGHRGELGEIDGQPEEPVQRAAREHLCMLIDGPAGEADRQARRVRRAILGHRERNRPAVDGHHALIRGCVPAVEGVVGAATQRPGREVEPKRRTRLDQQLAGIGHSASSSGHLAQRHEPAPRSDRGRQDITASGCRACRCADRWSGIAPEGRCEMAQSGLPTAAPGTA